MIMKKLLLILLAFALVGCNEDLPPIEADDFGYPKMSVYAKGKNVKGEETDQLAEWEFSGFKYNGDSVVIMVYNDSGNNTSIWSGWGCAGEGTVCNNVAKSGLCYIPTYCSDPEAEEETIYEPMCRFSKGQGLYLLLTDPQNESITDPNLTDNINRDPSSVNFYTQGLWQSTGIWNAGEEAGGYNGSIDRYYVDGEAYFKILDRYYDDNSGYFKMSLKRGFGSVVPTPIASITSFVTTAIDSSAESIFKNLNANPEFLVSLKIVLILYMIVGGMVYLGGITPMSQKELISHFIKLVIVIQLLTTQTSWEVFNNYFFTFFTKGLDEIISIVTRNMTGAGEGIAFFDSLLNVLYSYETSTKINALLQSFPCGFLVIVIVYCAFILVTIAIAQATIIYLLSYMAIALLISVAPVFITFMLFKSTRMLFENWLNQFANFFFQPVLVLAALNLVIQVILDRIYRVLGFKACYEDWLKITSGFVISKAWVVCDFNSQMETMAIPGYGYFDSNDPDRFCEPYECTGYRYIDLPFLDPDTDSSLIDAFHYGGNQLSNELLYESSILLIFAYLMLKFNAIVPDLAKGIAGTATMINTGGGGRNNSLANASNVHKDIGSTLSAVKDIAMMTKQGKALRMKIDTFKSKVRSKVGAAGAKVEDKFSAIGEGLQKGVSYLDNQASIAYQSTQEEDSHFLVKGLGKVGKGIGFIGKGVGKIGKGAYYTAKVSTGLMIPKSLGGGLSSTKEGRKLSDFANAMITPKAFGGGLEGSEYGRKISQAKNSAVMGAANKANLSKTSRWFLGVRKRDSTGDANFTSINERAQEFDDNIEIRRREAADYMAKGEVGKAAGVIADGVKDMGKRVFKATGISGVYRDRKRDLHEMQEVGREVKGYMKRKFLSKRKKGKDRDNDEDSNDHDHDHGEDGN